jgi:site-specific DNA-methyltransferase (adenine-specific)
MPDGITCEPYRLDYPSRQFGSSLLVHADCFEWMERIPANSFHAIVTDPPYGVKEYDFDQLTKRTNGKGGIWRIPPSFDGHTRSPLPRFTALNSKEREQLRRFFVAWGKLAVRVLRPGGHLFLAGNAFLSQFVFSAVVEGGFEFRGEIIRLVRTLRGGDRPKNAETDSERTPQAERRIADHPSLKPQSFLRQLVHAALPLGVGILADPFMGSGSTLAAAEALGWASVGVERLDDYFTLACNAVPELARIRTPILNESQPLLTFPNELTA